MKLFTRIVLGLSIAGVVLIGVGAWRAADAPRSRAILIEQLAELRPLLEAPDVSAEGVSAWSTHDHVEHLLRANEGILASIERGTPPETVEPKTWLGHFVLLTGRIPRGRGQAPPTTVPEGETPEVLLERLARVEAAAARLDTGALPDGVVAHHPVFGGFTAVDWLRLMAVHDAHHSRIIDDIRARAASAE